VVSFKMNEFDETMQENNTTSSDPIGAGPSIVEYDQRAILIRTTDLHELQEQMEHGSSGYDPDVLSDIEDQSEDVSITSPEPVFTTVGGRLSLNGMDVNYEPWGVLVNEYFVDIEVDGKKYNSVTQCVYSRIFEELDPVIAAQVRNMPVNPRRTLDTIRDMRKYSEHCWTKIYMNKMIGYIREALNYLLNQQSNPFYSTYWDSMYKMYIVPIYVFRHPNVWGVTDESQIASRDFNLYGKLLNKLIYDRTGHGPHGPDIEFCFIENGSPMDLFLGTNQEFKDQQNQVFPSIIHYVYYRFYVLFSQNPIESYSLIRANRHKPGNLEDILFAKINIYLSRIIEAVLPRAMGHKFMNYKELLIANARFMKYTIQPIKSNTFFPVDSIMARQTNTLFGALSSRYEQLRLPSPRISSAMSPADFEWIIHQRLPDILLTINTLFIYSGFPKMNVDSTVSMILDIFYAPCNCSSGKEVIVNAYPKEFFDMFKSICKKLDKKLWPTMNYISIYKIWRYLYCIYELKNTLTTSLPDTLAAAANYTPSKADVYLILYKQMYNVNQFNGRLFQTKSFNSVCKILYDLLNFQHKSIQDIKKLQHAALIDVYKQYKTSKIRYDDVRRALNMAVDERVPVPNVQKLLRRLMNMEIEYKHDQKMFYGVCETEYKTQNVFRDLSDVGLTNDKAKFRFLDIVDDVHRRKKSIYTTTKLYFYS
jgi:hypothetical protein